MVLVIVSHFKRLRSGAHSRPAGHMRIEGEIPILSAEMAPDPPLFAER